MKQTLQLEFFAGFVLALFLFSNLGYSWWLYLGLFFLPDLGMVGYLLSPRVGAFTYNLVHHLGLAVGCYLLGTWLALPVLQLVGTVLMGHLFFDRVAGYGLKYADAFRHTHLGTLK